jgi:hypothetical protein
MALTRQEKKALKTLKTAGGIALASAGAIGLYYLLTGAGKEKNSALIPDAIEDKLDRVVETLNRTFGKGWGSYAVLALQATLPAPLVGLVHFVHVAEQQHGLSGDQKRKHASQLWRTSTA